MPLDSTSNATSEPRMNSSIDGHTKAFKLKRIDPNASMMSDFLHGNHTVLVEGTPQSNIDRYLAALSIDPENSNTWNNLGYALEADKTVLVQGRAHSKADCYINALNIDPTNSEAWNNLGICLAADQSVLVQVNFHFKADCYVTALNLDPRVSYPWCNLGNCLEFGQTVLVQGKAYSKVNCYATALSIDPSNSYAWYNMGVSLGADETVSVHGKLYSKTDCYVTGLNLNSGISYAWCNLGNCLRADQTILVQGRAHSDIDCYVNALNADPRNSEAWYNVCNRLGAEETILLHEKAHSKADCCVAMLRIDPSKSNAWHNLGNCLKSEQIVDVQGKTYSQVDCFVAALNIDPSNSEAWCNLGRLVFADTLSSVGSKQYSKTECFIAAVLADMENAVAWDALADLLDLNETITLADRTYTRFQCYFAAWQLRSKSVPESWRYLGERLPFGLSITYDGKFYQNYDCFVKALNLDSNDPATWNALGRSLLPHSDLSLCCLEDGLYCINFSETTTREPTAEYHNNTLIISAFHCLVRAVLLNSASASYWAGVGQALLPDALVKINEVEYTKIGCYLKALECDLNYAPAWVLLAECDSGNSRNECCLEALRCDFKYPWPWRVLGDALEKWEDSIVVNGVPVSKRDCVERGLSETWHDWTSAQNSGFFDSDSLLGIASDNRSSNSGRIDVELAMSSYSQSVHSHSVRSMKVGPTIQFAMTELRVSVSDLLKKLELSERTLRSKIDLEKATIRSEIEFGSEVGKGVRKVDHCCQNGRPCVAKYLLTASAVFMSPADLDHHVAILNDTQLHPNIVHTERIIFDDKRDELVIVMERMDGCLKVPGAEHGVTGEPARCLRAIVVLAVARDILKALEHLAQKRIVHGDLKPENILYRKTDGPEEEWTYKLSDFDGAVKLTNHEGESRLSPMYTLAYASPERLAGGKEYPFAGDIWSLGVTLHVLRYGRFPFPQWRTEFQLQRFIMQGQLELSSAPETEDPVEAVLHEIIVDMVTFNPAQRLTSTDLLKKLVCVFGSSRGTNSRDSELPSEELGEGQIAVE